MNPNTPGSELGSSDGIRRRGTWQRVLAAVVVALLSGAIFIAHPGSAKADPNADEAQFFVLVNALRARLMLKPLASDPQATNVARVWSAQMAGDGTLSHNPGLGGQISDWRSLGENVGTGSNVAGIEAALEASPHHYENLTDPNYNYVGIGVVEAGGVMWVTQDFKQSKSGLPAAAVPAAAPAPRPKSAPAPKPPPAPRPASGSAAPSRSG